MHLEGLLSGQEGRVATLTLFSCLATSRMHPFTGVTTNTRSRRVFFLSVYAPINVNPGGGGGSAGKGWGFDKF